PVLFRIASHSKISPSVPVKNIYIYLEDTKEKAMAAKYSRSRKRPLPPRGKEEDIRRAVSLLDAHVYLFIIKYSEIIEPFRKEMDTVRDKALGPPSERGVHKASLDEHGVWGEGIAFERSLLAANVTGAQRCYTLGQSYQVQRKLTGPSVGAKIDDEILNHHSLRQSILKASAQVGIATLEAGDQDTAKVLRRQADCINLPRLGYAGNYAFPTMQLNVAATQKGNGGSGSLKNELGGFGIPHADQNDSPGGLTVVIANSDLSPGVEPGFFLLVELGVAVGA
ncbi:hypothetical protein L227DRAFT_512088, partial [Lentinus tigrinus ALCF2SS1-6]